MKVINIYIVWYKDDNHIMYETEGDDYYVLIDGSLIKVDYPYAKHLIDKV